MTSKDVILDVIEDLADDIRKDSVIQRDLTVGLIKSLKMEEVTVVKGVRRSGKTFMLYDLWKRFGGTYINFEDDRLVNFEISDFQKVLDIANENSNKILYLDEVQEVKGWEKFAHRIHRKMKIFVTGSNSRLLSSDYSKALVGRTRSFISNTLSYREFLRFRGIDPDRSSFLDYMKLGGFPRVVLTEDLNLVKEYLDRIIYRDIIARNEIKYPEALRSIALYLLSNVGKEFSYRSLREIGGLSHESTVKKYIKLLEEAFLLNIINAFSWSLKKQQRYSKKVYATDHSLASPGRRRGLDRGRMLENILYKHLRTQNDLYFFKDRVEVDLLLCDGLEPFGGINSTFEADNYRTLQREIKGLLKVKDLFDIRVELVSVYPLKGLPEGIENRLAHRYLFDLSRME
ncbi:MAG: ATP-binding protein [Candidatus Thermoplasmatota archaeon]|nr:ATP-binding protein [Candidatus Thermoplasmatota archaeon]